MNFDSQTGKKVKVIIIAMAAVVLVTVVALFTEVFESKQMKILTAVANTMADESKLAKACSALELLNSDAYTLYAKADVEGQEVDATLVSKRNEIQLFGGWDISGLPEMKGIIGVNSKEVRGTIDGLDTVVVYKFTEENDGDLINQIPKETIEIINDTLVMLTSDKEQSNISKKVSTAVLKVFNEWEIENAEKKSLKVDGKKHNCSGYTFSVDGERMENLSDAIVVALDGEVSDEILNSFEDFMSNEFEGMEDTDVTVYIYKDMLAAVIFEVGRDEVEVYFEGGSYRTQNVIVETDGYSVMEIAGNTDGSVEEYEVELAGRPVLFIKFNEKSGELSLREKYSGVNISIDALLKGKANELSFVIEDFDMDYYSLNCDLEINLKKGASLQKIDGEELDLGKADEDDLEVFIRELENILY